MYRLLATAVLIMLVGFPTYLSLKTTDMPRIQLKTDQATHEVRVEIAKTAEEQRIGLMNRDELREGRGMLFPYEKSQRVSYWMKNTLIPLDMIFIGSDLTIKHIEHNVPICSDDPCTTYSSRQPIQYVLEVPAGYAKKHQVQVGDEFIIVDPFE